MSWFNDFWSICSKKRNYVKFTIAVVGLLGLITKNYLSYIKSENGGYYEYCVRTSCEA